MFYIQFSEVFEAVQFVSQEKLRQTSDSRVNNVRITCLVPHHPDIRIGSHFTVIDTGSISSWSVRQLHIFIPSDSSFQNDIEVWYFNEKFDLSVFVLSLSP